MGNSENYLNNLPDWTPESAEQLAAQQDIVLTPAHIDILMVARAFYGEFGFAPSMRPLCKSVADSLGVEMGRSIYLNQQFPGTTAKLVALFAGLPKPKNCL